ncbi:hypothetical protein [Methylocucumis oryzae]|nr:hypothetical protein [Methylocucumis oryzae]
MKTILLEIEDKTYQTVLDFIKLLPENRCRIIEDDNSLSENDHQHIQACLNQISQGDYSDFEDWDRGYELPSTITQKRHQIS